MNQIERQPSSSKSKQIIFILILYIILTSSNRFSTESNEFDEIFVTKIREKREIKIQSILQDIDGRTFQGEWRKDSAIHNSIFKKEKGKYDIQIKRYSSNLEQKLKIGFCMKEDEYKDDGQVYFDLIINNTNQEPNLNILDQGVCLNFTPSAKAHFREHIIFETKAQGDFNIKNLTIVYSIPNGNSLQKTLLLEIENQKFTFQLERKEYNMSGTFLLVFILFTISYRQFGACIFMMTQFIQNRDSPSNYSLLSLLMALMWDTALCMTTFFISFQNQENIVLFIIPALLLFLVIASLQLKFIKMVFRSFTDQNNSAVLTTIRFYITFCGCIYLMNLMIKYYNMGSILFIAFSCIFFPQIYLNTIKGIRPNLNSVYYLDFLLLRFLIVLYLRCFPYNIFELRPNYALGIFCFILIGGQFLLLWGQKKYGPKKFVPKCLLPPVYDYSFNFKEIKNSGESLELQSQQCLICLQRLEAKEHLQNSQINVGLEIMRTPCNHLFHGACLSKWMMVKKQCPKCRKKLPLLE